MGLNTAWRWAFFLFSSFLCISVYQWWFLNQVLHRIATLLIFVQKVCSAVQLEVKQAEYAQIAQKQRTINLILGMNLNEFRPRLEETSL